MKMKDLYGRTVTVKFTWYRPQTLKQLGAGVITTASRMTEKRWNAIRHGEPLDQWDRGYHFPYHNQASQ